MLYVFWQNRKGSLWNYKNVFETIISTNNNSRQLKRNFRHSRLEYERVSQTNTNETFSNWFSHDIDLSRYQHLKIAAPMSKLEYLSWSVSLRNEADASQSFFCCQYSPQFGHFPLMKDWHWRLPRILIWFFYDFSFKCWHLLSNIPCWYPSDWSGSLTK